MSSEAALIRAAHIKAAHISEWITAHAHLVPAMCDTTLHVGAYAHATYMWACTIRAIKLFLKIVDFVM